MHVHAWKICQHCPVLLCQKSLALRFDLFLNKRADPWSCVWQPCKTQKKQTRENPWVTSCHYIEQLIVNMLIFFERDKLWQNSIPKRHGSPVLFASLIIRLFQLVFSAGTMFFSPNKSTETVFWLVFSAKRTDPNVSVCSLWRSLWDHDQQEAGNKRQSASHVRKMHGQMVSNAIPLCV